MRDLQILFWVFWKDFNDTLVKTYLQIHTNARTATIPKYEKEKKEGETRQRDLTNSSKGILIPEQRKTN